MMLSCLSRAIPKHKVKLEYVGPPTISKCDGLLLFLHPNQASDCRVTGGRLQLRSESKLSHSARSVTFHSKYVGAPTYWIFCSSSSSLQGQGFSFWDYAAARKNLRPEGLTFRSRARGG